MDPNSGKASTTGVEKNSAVDAATSAAVSSTTEAQNSTHQGETLKNASSAGPPLPPETSDVSGNQMAPPATVQPQAQTLYPLRLIVDNHTHNGVAYLKGQTIALDEAEYAFAVRMKLGLPGLKENVGLEVDAQGEPIKPQAPEPVALPTDQAINA
jgi:hypothetical protein